MSEVTRILAAIEQGDPHAAEQLLPLVYDELRQLAAQKLAQEKPGQTLQATALVHEAYLRLVDVDKVQHWDSRGHFFAAAAEAMRRILVERARRKRAAKRGGGIYNASALLTVSGSTITGNEATGGAGGADANGGVGQGGGIFSRSEEGIPATVTITNTTVRNNQATGGAGGAGNGGVGQGGGIFNGAGSTMSVSHSDILANQAVGGAAGSGGTAGVGTGGGVFNEGLISLDALTVVLGNLADVFAECFGCP